MKNKINILFAEDEQALGMIVRDSLQSRDFAVDYFDNGKDALASFLNKKYDILVLDVMMPEMDGFTLASEVRKINNSVPIIFLTAKSQVEDVVEGFEIGGNDYLKKPFSMEELIVRIKALTGRIVSNNTAQNLEIINIGEYTFDYVNQTLKHQLFEKQLTHREAELLKILCSNRNSVVDRKATLLDLWGDDSFFNARSMDVFITKLRKYLKHDPSIQIINIRGIGYKLVY